MLVSLGSDNYGASNKEEDLRNYIFIIARRLYPLPTAGVLIVKITIK
jgi:hypothetical protein